MIFLIFALIGYFLTEFKDIWYKCLQIHLNIDREACARLLMNSYNTNIKQQKLVFEVLL